MVRAAELLWWWGVCVGVWLLTLSSVGAAELAVAALCGLPCAVAGRAGRIAVGGTWHPRARWVWWPVPLAVVAVADAARVLLVPLRRPRRGESPGELAELHLPGGESPDTAATRRALAILAVSATPGTFVVDSDPERGVLVTHSLVRGRPGIGRVVLR